MPTTLVPVRTVTPSRSSWRRAEAERSFGYGGRTRSSASTRTIRAWRRVDRAEVALQGVLGDLAERAGQLDAGRAAADDDERHPLGPADRVGFPLGRLEGDEDPPPDLGRVVDRLEARRVARPLVVAEVRVADAGRDDERVVADRPAVGHADLAPDRIERDGLAEEHRRVRPLAEDRAQRLGDLAGASAPGRDLVEQRLEEMEVAPVDERDRDPVVAAQPARRVQPAEPAADDQDPMPVRGRARGRRELPWHHDRPTARCVPMNTGPERCLREWPVRPSMQEGRDHGFVAERHQRDHAVRRGPRAAKQFYGRAFGLPIMFEDDASAVFHFGNTLINLLRTSEAPRSSSIRPWSRRPTRESRMQFTIDVDDVDAMCADLTARGVELLNGPMDRPWGIRTASFRDPAGHIWEIAKAH